MSDLQPGLSCNMITYGYEFEDGNLVIKHTENDEKTTNTCDDMFIIIFTFNRITNDMKYIKYELRANKEYILNSNSIFSFDFSILFTIIKNVSEIDIMEKKAILNYKLNIFDRNYDIKFTLPKVKLTSKEEKKLSDTYTKKVIDNLKKENLKLKIDMKKIQIKMRRIEENNEYSMFSNAYYPDVKSAAETILSPIYFEEYKVDIQKYQQRNRQYIPKEILVQRIKKESRAKGMLDYILKEEYKKLKFIFSELHRIHSVKILSCTKFSTISYIINVKKTSSRFKYFTHNEIINISKSYRSNLDETIYIPYVNFMSSNFVVQKQFLC